MRLTTGLFHIVAWNQATPRDLPDRLARNIFLGDWAGNNGFAANLSDFNKTGLNVLVKAAPRARFQLTDFIDFEVPVPKPVLKTEFVLSHG
jgi:hypothetical protein